MSIDYFGNTPILDVSRYGDAADDSALIFAVIEKIRERKA